MFKKIIILAMCLSLLAATACADSSSKADGSSASNSSSAVNIPDAPADDRLWNDPKYVSLRCGVYIPVPNGFTAVGEPTSIGYIYTDNVDSAMAVTEQLDLETLDENFIKSKVDWLSNAGQTSSSELSWKCDVYNSEIIDINGQTAVMIYFKETDNIGKENEQTSDRIDLYINGNEKTVEISLSGKLAGSGNFEKFCSLLEIPGAAQSATEISFDDVNYVEVDDLMIPIPMFLTARSLN